MKPGPSKPGKIEKNLGRPAEAQTMPSRPQRPGKAPKKVWRGPSKIGNRARKVMSPSGAETRPGTIGKA